MAAIKSRNEDFDIISKDTDGSFRNSRQSKTSSHKANGSLGLDFSAKDSLNKRGR